MVHAQKPDFVFRRKGRVHLNRREHQFSRLLAVEVCASEVVMMDTPSSGVVWRVLASFPFTSPPVRHRVPSHFTWTLQSNWSVFLTYVHFRTSTGDFYTDCLYVVFFSVPTVNFRFEVSASLPFALICIKLRGDGVEKVTERKCWL